MSARIEVYDGGMVTIKAGALEVNINLSEIEAHMDKADCAKLLVHLTDETLIATALERLINGLCDCPIDNDEDIKARADILTALGENHESDVRHLISERDRALRDAAVLNRTIVLFLREHDSIHYESRLATIRRLKDQARKELES